MIKNNIKLFIGIFIGILFSSGVAYAYIINALNVSYDNSNSHLKNANNQDVTNVSDAIDALYTKANESDPESYTGSYTYTPSTNTQTIYTSNKLLNSDITINAIPSGYKDVTMSTINNANDIVKGKKAYLSDGTLVNGNRDECVVGNLLYQEQYVNTFKTLADFTPNYFIIYSDMINEDTRFIYYYNKTIDSTKYFRASKKSNEDNPSIGFENLGSIVSIDNNNLAIKFTKTGWVGKTLYFIACK